MKEIRDYIKHNKGKNKEKKKDKYDLDSPLPYPDKKNCDFCKINFTDYKEVKYQKIKKLTY